MSEQPEVQQVAPAESNKGRLTWVAGDKPVESLDPVSQKILAASADGMNGTSIFDPVLCELSYRWYCPPGGKVLDCFAGGSVRGIVAGVLGYQYTGVDLREDQVAANTQQAEEIFNRLASLPSVDAIQNTSGLREVRISSAMARLPFNGCDPEYIRTTCHASCCQSSTSPTGTIITVHPTEEPAIAARGGVVLAGLLQPRAGEKRCPFKNEVNLCGIHFTPDKPFGCIASPFTLNSNGTLIVRNRYKSLKCYNQGPQLPAYVAFRASLDLIFGATESARICEHLEAGGGDLTAYVSDANYAKLVDNDAIKHGVVPGSQPAPQKGTQPPAVIPHWVAGDSLNIETVAPGEYDFLFSCPPYADLEVYSEDARDLSAIAAENYDAFRVAYKGIIAASCRMLKPDSFACFVIGEVRRKDGSYYNFVGDTVNAFVEAGLSYYNESILVTSLGSLPVRAGRQFAGGRKIGKTHQNVLVFLKGDWHRAVAKLGSDCQFGEMPAGAEI